MSLTLCALLLFYSIYIIVFVFVTIYVFIDSLCSPKALMAPSKRGSKAPAMSSSSTHSSIRSSLATTPHGMRTMYVNSYLSPILLHVDYPLRLSPATDNGSIYDSMNIIFDAGKLVGEDMNQCYQLIQRASQVFPDNQVSGLRFQNNLLSLSHVLYL